MSRVAKNPVVVPSGVEVNIAPGGLVSVKGPLGTLSHKFNDDVVVARDGDKVVFKTAKESQQAGAMSGTARALVANMVQGVSKGYEKKLT